MYTDAQVGIAGLAAHLPYLGNHARGGRAGRAGLDYEDFYAIYRLALAAAAMLPNAPNWGGNADLTFWSQPANCFVDDIVLTEGVLTEDEHCQLKNAASLHWGRRHGSLSWCINQQHVLSSASGRKALCRIVNRNHKLVRKLNNARSTALRLKGARAVFFPFHAKLEGYVRNYRPFRRALEAIIAKERPSHNELVQVATLLRAVWQDAAAGGAGGSVTLEQALQRLAQYAGTYLRPIQGDYALTTDFTRILGGIPGLRIRQYRGYLNWVYNTRESGTLSYSCHSDRFVQFEQWVLTHRPTDFDQLAGWLA